MPPHPTFLCRPLYLGHRALLTYRSSRMAAVAARSVLAQQDKSGPVVPVRFFGRGRRGVVFGHGRSPMANNYTATMLLIFGFGLFTPWMDWEKIHEKTGFYIPFFYNLFTHDRDGTKFSESKDEYMASSIPEDLRDRQREVHNFMLEQAEKDYNRKTASEEEVNKSFLDMVKDRSQVKAEEKEEKGFLERVRARTSVKAEEAKTASEAGIESDAAPTAEEDQQIKEVTEGKKKVGFRNRKIIEYENRIRQYSTPDKIFRYFATYKVSDEKGRHSEVMMTPEDFLRSITPGSQQPEHLGLDQFHNLSIEELNGSISLDLGVEQSSIFYQLGGGGLITFSDYIFLLTVLSTSRRHFEIAFKMFDLNGDGNVDAKEFEVVTNLMKSQSSMGARHRDHGNTGSTFKGINSGLITFFFGDDREGNLTVDKFLEFQRCLQNEILALEFKRKCGSEEEVISEKDFAELLIAYAGFPPKKKVKMLKRVRKAFKAAPPTDEGEEEGAEEGSKSPGIRLSDYLSFYQVLYSINDIDTALTFYHMAGAPIERDTMRHVAKTVANVELSDHVIDVVFVLFDEDGDGRLSNKEFVSVMKQRAMRGLEKPKDTGIGKVFSAIAKCASDTRPTILGGVRKTE